MKYKIPTAEQMKKLSGTTSKDKERRNKADMELGKQRVADFFEEVKENNGGYYSGLTSINVIKKNNPYVYQFLTMYPQVLTDLGYTITDDVIAVNKFKPHVGLVVVSEPLKRIYFTS